MQRKILMVVFCPVPVPKILLLRRTEKDSGEWQPITGHVEDQEDYVDAAIRELLEETNIQANFIYDLGIEQQFPGRWGEAIEKAFGLRVEEYKIPILSEEHDDFAWYDISTAIAKITYPHQQEAIRRASQIPAPIILNKEGTWWQDGEEITHQRTKDLFYTSLQKNSRGHYELRIDKESAPVIIEDCAYFIKQYNPSTGEVLLLNGKTLLLPINTCYLENENQLYCVIDGEKTKFLRAAYYQITQTIREEKNGSGEIQYFLHFLGRDYLLPITHK